MAKKAKKLDRVGQIMAYESGELSDAGVIEMFQSMIDDGSVWSLQGSYGRMAADLIAAGHCQRAEVRHKDYYGHTLPSRYDVVKEG